MVSHIVDLTAKLSLTGFRLREEPNVGFQSSCLHTSVGVRTPCCAVRIRWWIGGRSGRLASSREVGSTPAEHESHKTYVWHRTRLRDTELPRSRSGHQEPHTSSLSKAHVHPVRLHACLLRLQGPGHPFCQKQPRTFFLRLVVLLRPLHLERPSSSSSSSYLIPFGVHLSCLLEFHQFIPRSHRFLAWPRA